MSGHPRECIYHTPFPYGGLLCIWRMDRKELSFSSWFSEPPRFFFWESQSPNIHLKCIIAWAFPRSRTLISQISLHTPMYLAKNHRPIHTWLPCLVLVLDPDCLPCFSSHCCSLSPPAEHFQSGSILRNVDIYQSHRRVRVEMALIYLTWSQVLTLKCSACVDESLVSSW